MVHLLLDRNNRIMMNKNILLTITALLLVQCSTYHAKHTSNTDAERIIRQNSAAFSRDLVNGNFEAVTQAYAPDAKIFPPGLDILQKHEAIRKYWTPPPERESRTVHHLVTPAEIEVTGNYAYDWGYYEGRSRMGDGSEQAWRGKYVIVWKQTKPGEWKIYLDAWNRVN